MNAASKIRPLEAIIMTALFAILISLPFLKMLTVGEPDTQQIEKRALSPMPKFGGSWKWQVKNLPRLFDAYYSDHFGFRSMLLEAGSIINIELFRTSPRAAFGKNGWLFYKTNPPFSSLSLSADDLAKWKGYLEYRQQWLAARGIKYLFVVAPDKDSIYPEFLPGTVTLPRENMVDQLARYLKETHSSVNILSLEDALLASKAQEQQPVFYKQDGHWNSLGGFYGYQAIMGRLVKWFPGLKVKSRQDFRMEMALDDGQDIVLQAGFPEFSKEKEPELKPLTPRSAQTHMLQLAGFLYHSFMTENQHPAGLPRAVMMRDSFTIALAPYLSEHFSRITYLWTPAPDPPELENAMADIIRQEKPDIFIEERVQRFLCYIPDKNDTFGGGGEAGSPVKQP
jgi:hypothetical protein